MMTLRIGMFVALVLALPWLALGQPAVSINVPADVQVALFVNIWKLDRNFDASKIVVLAIVYQESYAASLAAKDELVAAIEKQKLHITAVPYEVGHQELVVSQMNAIKADIVYVTP